MKIGTNTNEPIPIKKMIFFSLSVMKLLVALFEALLGVVNSPLKLIPAMIRGTNIANKEGMNKLVITEPEVILPFTHNMMVVTSPIGEKAPPALAAMTNSRVFPPFGLVCHQFTKQHHHYDCCGKVVQNG